jgi:NAD(P)-dependent dehydrogenase (short-subunit alcohol dehydrogenase family)
VIDFDEQVVVVTGGGRGLGRLYALELARRGAQVVVNDLGSSMKGLGADPGIADEVVNEICREGGTAISSHDSVDNPEGGAAIVKTALDAFGRLDAVVSNAGIYGMVSFEDLSVDEWRRMLRVHLDGGFYVGQPAFRAMKSQGYGRFVFIASNIGAFGQEYVAHYAAARGGLIGLTNALANEGRPHGILANTVLPIGYSRMVGESVRDRRILPQEERFFRAIAPEHVVPMVVFLASRACNLTHHNFSAAPDLGQVSAQQGWLIRR